jgi:hypothetical protein
MRKLLITSVIAVIAFAGCTQTDQPNGVAVRGFQAPGGWGVFAEQKVASSIDLAPGSSAYMGASADGSMMGFITADGTIHWYRTASR